MKKIILMLAISLSFKANAQLNYTPQPMAAYISGDGINWSPWSSAAGFGGLAYTPQSIGLYCQASAGAAWTPCVPGSGGGGTTTFPLTMNNSGAGAASGTTFNGGAAVTLSYNTIGAQQALTLTTTGTSGAATLVGGTLNIPQYSGGGSGTVTSVSGLTPLFTTTNPSTTPTFVLSNAAQNSVFAGPATGGAGAPSYQTAPTFSAANLTNVPACSTCATSANNLGFFASTTSAQLAGVLSDETGTGSVVFSNSPTLVTPALGTPSSGVVTNLTGTGAFNTTGTAGNITATSNSTLTTLSSLSLPGSQLTGTVPAGVLPLATTSAFGAVKPDGTTITISSGVISSVGGGGNTTTTGGTALSIPVLSAATTQVNSPLAITGTTGSPTGVTSTVGITAPGYSTTSSVNGFSNFTYTGSAATAPGTNTWQISPAVSITTPWSFSPAGAPATGVWYGTNTAGVVQQSFKSLQGTDSNILTAGTVSGTGSTLCTDANGGATTSGCSSGSVSHYYTSSTFTGIGPTSFTPTHTLDIKDTTATTGSTNVFITSGAGQSGNVFEVDTGGTSFTVAAFGSITMGTIGILNTAATTGAFGVLPLFGDTASLGTTRTAAIAATTLTTSRAFGPGGTLQAFEVDCYMNTKVGVASSSATLTLSWKDDVQTQSQTYTALATTTTGAQADYHKALVATSTGNVATNITYAVAITGSPQYGVQCWAKGID